MLKRFYDLRKEIADFMKMKAKSLPQICDPTWLRELAFLIDITGNLNDLNLKLQKQGRLANQRYLQDATSHLRAFQNKTKNCFNFLRLSSIEYGRYAQKLKLLSKQFYGRFSNFKNMDSTH